MNNENDDEPSRDDNDDAANDAVPRPTRRQFLKGLTTGTVAIGALTQPAARRRFRRSKPAAQPPQRPSVPSAASAAARSCLRGAAR